MSNLNRIEQPGIVVNTIYITMTGLFTTFITIWFLRDPKTPFELVFGALSYIVGVCATSSLCRAAIQDRIIISDDGVTVTERCETKFYTWNDIREASYLLRGNQIFLELDTEHYECIKITCSKKVCALVSSHIDIFGLPPKYESIARRK